MISNVGKQSSMLGNHFPQLEIIIHGGISCSPSLQTCIHRGGRRGGLQPPLLCGYPFGWVSRDYTSRKCHHGKKKKTLWEIGSHRGKYFPTLGSGFPPGKSFPTVSSVPRHRFDLIFLTVSSFSRTWWWWILVGIQPLRAGPLALFRNILQ